MKLSRVPRGRLDLSSTCLLPGCIIKVPSGPPAPDRGRGENLTLYNLHPEQGQKGGGGGKEGG